MVIAETNPQGRMMQKERRDVRSGCGFETLRGVQIVTPHHLNLDIWRPRRYSLLTQDKRLDSGMSRESGIGVNNTQLHRLLDESQKK